MSLRDEFGEWMRENFCAEFEVLRGRGTPGDEDVFPDLRKKWERTLGAAGWIGLAWPDKYGGRQASLEDLVAVNEEYALQGGCGRAGHIGETLLAPTLIAFGTETQKQKYLPGIRAGTDFWCQGYSEPNAGSDLSNINTKARLEEDQWVLEGQKVWTSLALEANYCFVLARAVVKSKGRDGLVFLLVRLDQPGIDIRPIRQMSGTAEFNEIYFDGARCHKTDLVGQVGQGWRIAMALLDFERGASTLGQQMIFSHEFQLLIRLAKKNGTAQDPFIRQRLAKAYTELKIMRFSALRLLSAINQGDVSPVAFMSKLFWANWHRNLGELAMDIMGPEAEILENNTYSKLQKLFLFSRADTIYAGTNEIQRNIISERALSMPKEPRGYGGQKK